MTAIQEDEYRDWQRQQILPRLNEFANVLQERHKEGKACTEEMGVVQAVIDYLAQIPLYPIPPL